MRQADCTQGNDLALFGPKNADAANRQDLRVIWAAGDLNRPAEFSRDELRWRPR
jgi:hypothetical protein